MTDDSTNLSTDKLVSQTAPVASTLTPSPVATLPIVTPAVTDSDVTPPDTTGRVATPSITLPAPHRDTVIDPRVIALRAMFPDYDDLILCVHSSRCPSISLLLIHIGIAGYLCLNLWAETRIALLMHYSV